MLMDENHFISLLFTLRASRRLPSAALLRPRHPAISGIASALSAPASRDEASKFYNTKGLRLQMKASDSCKIQVIGL